MTTVHKRLIAVLLLLSLLTLGGWLIDNQRNASRSTLSGYFETQPIEVSSRVQGRVANILVREGDQVHRGQALVVLEADPSRYEAQARLAQATLARKQLEEAVHGPRVYDIRRQEQAVSEMSADLARLVHGPRPQEIDEARAQLAAATAAYRKAVAGPRPQEIAEATAAADEALAHLQQAQRGAIPPERAEAQARLAGAVAEATKASRDLQRYRMLYQAQAVTSQQLDQVTAAAKSAQASAEDAAQQLKALQIGTPKEEMAQARQAFYQAKAALDLVRAGTRPEDIDSARAQVAQATAALSLLLAGSRPEDIDAARARLGQAQEQLAELKAGTRPEQIAEASASLAAAIGLAKSSTVAAAEWKVAADSAATVDRVLVAVGDLAPPGSSLVRLTDPTDIWIRVYVPESSLSRIAVGDLAKLRVDGISQVVDARVESIASTGEFTPVNLQTPEERGRQVFAVRLRPEPMNSRIKPGMYATVIGIGAWH